jgi:hypothetical protein
MTIDRLQTTPAGPARLARRAAPAWPAASLAAVLCLLVAAPASEAQYFGRNKVQYQDFDFQVLQTEHFDIYHYPQEAEAVAFAARLAERWYARLSQVLRHELSGRQPLILYAGQPHFQQTNVVAGLIGEGTGGVTESLKRRIVLPFAAGLAATDHVLGHELVHAFQYDMLDPRAANALPLWFIEGMAEYLSLGSTDAQTAMWMRDAALSGDLPVVDDLNDPRYFPYRYGHALWAYVAGRWGDEVCGNALRAAGNGGSGAPAGGGSAPGEIFETLLGLDMKALSADWHDAIRRDMVQPVAGRGDAVAGALLIRTDDERPLDIGPALSPDGRLLAFLSARDRLSLDLYVADAQTGEVQRRVLSTAADPHFDSLQFLQSAGAWNPAGTELVVAAVRHGRPVLVTIDVATGRRLRQIDIPQADEAFQPAWSPDGRAIAFSGMRGGLSDLFVYDLASDRVVRLTEDAFADLHPAWSPDGRSLAFTTDRFASGLEALDFGPYELARIDVASRRIDHVPAFRDTRHSNPQWSGDGSALFFIATFDGIPDVYRVDVEGGVPVPVTRVQTGVSGITALSPALSVAGPRDRMAFVLYRDGGQRIHVAEGGQGLAVETRVQTGAAIALDAAQLAPIDRQGPRVDRLLDRPALGLPSPAAASRDVVPYEASLSLDYVGQEFGAVGISPFGARAVGGVSFLWSDMLAGHTLATTLQISGSFDDIGGQAAYINRTSRWNWAGVVEQLPYVTGSFASGIGTVDGVPSEIQQSVRFRQIDREVSGVTAYPFSRAQRLELGGGLRRSTFTEEVVTQAISLETGDLILDEQTDRDIFDPVTLGFARAALVYDTSVLGATGPILGQRYRFEVTPTAGDLTFTGALADYRRYDMPVRPWTFATRLLHVGRYGRDAESGRLGSLFLGYPTLVRGYEIDSLEARECPAAADGRCPVLDKLLGSRVLVANVELRVPIVGAFTGDFDYGPVPVEAFAFFDAGTAWSSGESPLAASDWHLVRSTGAGLRINALGYLIVELDMVRPLDRPNRDWRFAFTISPGF